jgi:glycosyltransferase involved in cell wall biosynthesis
MVQHQPQSDERQPIVSVIVPAYNDERYVVTCMRSLLAQTLEDIEIICVNDGSTDGTSQVLHGFAERDPRIRVIDKENGGYGSAINRGLDEARGRYIGILESDDFANPDTFETLAAYAKAFNLDVARANFNWYWSDRLRKDVPLLEFGERKCDRVIDPRLSENRFCFFAQPALWSAIYRAGFIRENRLRLLETPGIAFQDTSFNFKIWACARRVMFAHQPFVHHRRDNEKYLEMRPDDRPGKEYDICREYHEIDRWLSEDRPDLRKALAPVKNKLMCGAYLWILRIIDEPRRLEFAKQIGRELKAAIDADEVDPSLFSPDEYALLVKSTTDPQGFVDSAIHGDDAGQGSESEERTNRPTAFAKDREGDQSGAGGSARLVDDKGTPLCPVSNIVDRADAELIVVREPRLVDRAPSSPEVSVVMPVYNSADVLGDTLDSVLSQSLENFELICVDDGSTDGTGDILRSYAKKDARIRVISQANAGPGAARNAGMAQARAPFLMFLDSDDIYDYRLLRLLHDRLEQTGADIAVCRSCEFTTGDIASRQTHWTLKANLLPASDAEPFSPQELGDGLFIAFLGWPWDRMFRTEFVRETGVEFPSLANSEDGPFVYETLALASKIATVRKVLVRHRVGRQGSVSNARLAAPEEFYRAIVMVKDFVRTRTPKLYASTERGLLNWAADFALWNIASLPEGEARRKLAEKLLSGGYPALELFEHPEGYFSLFPMISERVSQLRSAYGEPSFSGKEGADSSDDASGTGEADGEDGVGGTGGTGGAGSAASGTER